MSIIASVFLVISLWLGVLFGGQTEGWSWGPAILALGCAMVFALWGRPLAKGGWVLWVSMLLAAGWIVLRCAQSAVIDYARADFMLVLVLVGIAWVVRSLSPSGRGIQVVYFGLALCVLANVVMAAVQWRIPEVMWPYSQRPTAAPTGFFSHYNYFANFVVGATLLLLGRIVFGDDRPWQRVVYGLAALGSSVMVPLSGSRGGVLALALGIIVFLIAVGVVAHRRKKKWFFVVVISVPILVIGAAIGGVILLKEVQEMRGQREGVVATVDSSSRLGWVRLALEVSSDHLALGGGSRSYSWERNKKWDIEEYGYGYENEPFVHNELLQVVVDYGAIGGALVIGALGVLAATCVVGLVMGRDHADGGGQADSILVGVCAAGAAILVQANFSFVFHMLPSVMLLGLLFGLTLAAYSKDGSMTVSASWARRGFGVILVSCAGFLGWAGSVTLWLIWPVLYERESMAIREPQAAMRRLEVAEKNWPGFRVPQEIGNWSRIMASDPRGLGDDSLSWNLAAVDAYQRAFRFHPFDPELALNLGNACSASGLYDEAEVSLEKAIDLQGGLEVGFRARYFLASHLFSAWQERWIRERRAEEALAQFIRARQLLKDADAIVPWGVRIKFRDLKVALNEAIKFLEGAGIQPAPITK